MHSVIEVCELICQGQWLVLLHLEGKLINDPANVIGLTVKELAVLLHRVLCSMDAACDACGHMLL